MTYIIRAKFYLEIFKVLSLRGSCPEEVFTPVDEGTLAEGEHLPESYAKAPDVGFFRVFLLSETLQCQPLDGYVDIGAHHIFIIIYSPTIR
jgi:hypothetical protein